MVSMKKSMGKALNVIKYTIVWFILGIILIFIGQDLLLNQKLDSLKLIGALLIFFGIIIISCGFLASFMKILTELIIEESTNNVPEKEDIKLKEQPKEEYTCGKCKSDISKFDKFCPKCDEPIEWTLPDKEEIKESKENYDWIWYTAILLALIFFIIKLLQVL